MVLEEKQEPRARGIFSQLTPAAALRLYARERRARHLFLISACVLLTVSSAGATPAADAATMMRVPGGMIEITLPSEPMRLSSADLLAWVKDSAGAVSEYYGHFPVPHLSLQIRAGRGSRVGRGVTYPRDGGLIRVTVGAEAQVDDLKQDWVLTHEMTHLAFPNMPDQQHWIEEGLATYVEPVARAQVGRLPAAEVWREFIRDMPQGEPAEDDAGLDHTPTWGRTYWGGAIFCLLADVEIRGRTNNRRGLQDALRAILDHGGAITQDWEITKALAIGDKATGTTVLEDLYRKMRDKPAPVDLDQIWKRLGLGLQDGRVTFNDQARDSAIRRAITSKDGTPHKVD
jgi:hypothetical protein